MTGKLPMKRNEFILRKYLSSRKERCKVGSQDISIMIGNFISEKQERSGKEVCGGLPLRKRHVSDVCSSY